jgi:hypothetical protein
MTSVVWGPRSATRRDSFWLRPPVLVGDPVRVRAFAQVPTRDWLLPTSGQELAVAYFRENAEATFVLPDPPPAAIALDFDLRLEVGSVRGTGLRLRQLCTVGAGGALLPSRYARRDVSVTVVPNKGVTIADRPQVELVGRHPLLSFTTAGVRLDAEFLDVTELWWGLRNARTSPGEPRGDWYVHPALGGHPDRLRILAATTPGAGPMLWMAWTSQAAAAPAKTIQPLVFIIASAWLNGLQGFAHKLGPEGLITAATSGKPLYSVGRFLLSAVPSAQLDIVRKATPTIPEPDLWQLAVEVLKATVPRVVGMGGRAWPEVLLEVGPDGAATVRAVLPLTSDSGHRPAGHEAAADDSGKPLLLVYPVGVNGGEPYASVGRPGLAERMRSLVGTMFSCGAVAGTATVAPATDDLILGGHSNGNGALWVSLAVNGADIAKCMAFDAASPVTPEANQENIRIGVEKRGSKPFALILVTSPNSYNTVADLKARVSNVKLAMRSNPSASLVMLPAEAIQGEFWNPRNAAPTGKPTKNELLRQMLSPWTQKEIEDATTPSLRPLWGFLFFHEFAAYGGQSLTKTFFREALDL